uniref:Prolamin-like domain-containing protein n=1 Tax=Oryza punctata TaxID=4537 RepID=A0A0E0KM99_ORYPU
MARSAAVLLGFALVAVLIIGGFVSDAGCTAAGGGGKHTAAMKGLVLQEQLELLDPSSFCTSEGCQDCLVEGVVSCFKEASWSSFFQPLQPAICFLTYVLDNACLNQ